jgi:hydrogenase maturation protease
MQYLHNGERFLSFAGSSVPPSTIIIGLGNPILGDDGVGWHIAQGVMDNYRLSSSYSRRQTTQTDAIVLEDIEVDCLSVGGLSLMERLVGYKRAIIIDAIQTGQTPIGQIICASLDDFSETATGHLSSAHDTSLQQAIRIGRTMGAQLPNEIIIVGVETNCVYEFSESLSAPVSAALPTAINLVLELII